MAKKKKAAKKRRSPKRVTTVQVTKKTAIGRSAAKPVKRRNSNFYMKAAKDLLYDELAGLFIKREKATTKSDRKKIGKKITAKKQQINRLK